jgi:L-threonylcarbamoyladenylate synthase
LNALATELLFQFKWYLCAVSHTGKDIELAAELLSRGKLVAIPTETVYGLAANALDEKAVLSIFEAKKRPFFDPLIVHVHSTEAVSKYATFNDDRLQKLAAQFWPGPLTILLPKKNNIPPIVTSGLDQVAIRIPRHPLTLQLLEKLDLPLAAPSANPFGYVSPTRPEHVARQLGNKIDYILDGGDCTVGIESTIVGIENNRLCVFRLGGLAPEAIEKVVGRIEFKLSASSDPRAPGQLQQHYATRKPLFSGDVPSLLSKHDSQKIAVIIFGDQHLQNSKNVTVYNLSASGNLNEAALNLFSTMRLADESDAEIVIAAQVPDEGLGKAINDRLRRASA